VRDDTATARRHSFMKFRFVLLQPDDDPNGHPPARKDAPAPTHGPSQTLRYEQRGMGMVRVDQLKNGHWKSTSIANFTARIVSDIIRDDGDEESRDFGVEAEIGRRRLVFAVAAAEFGRMGWVLQKLGPQAVIYPGQQQHARAAIQMLSGSIRQERVFAHLGWSKLGPDGCTCTRPAPWVRTARCPTCGYTCRRLCSTTDCEVRKMPII
jgi:hypothetical protein